MHGVVAAQLCEKRPPAVVLVEQRIADIDRREVVAFCYRLGHRHAPKAVTAWRAIGRGTIEWQASTSKVCGKWFRHAGNAVDLC